MLGRGYHLTTDKLFLSSPKLFLDLYADKTFATGTVRVNRKGLPPQIRKPDPKLRAKQVLERRKGPLLAVAYKDGSKQPILLSTLAHGCFVNSGD